MTGAYPGNLNSSFYEERRAAEVREKSQGFYTVIDHHNINMNYFEPNEKGYWADLVVPTTVPDDTWWPSE